MRGVGDQEVEPYPEGRCRSVTKEQELKERSLKMLNYLKEDSREARFYSGILYALWELEQDA